MSGERGRRDAQDGGFVLIEILVALSVVALMGALMAGVLGHLRAAGNVKEQVLARVELSAAVGHLQRTLSGARKVALDRDEGDGGVLRGEAGRMRFVAATRQGFHSLAFRDVGIFVERAGGASRLVQTQALRRPDAGPGGAAWEEPALRVVVMEDISDASFEYSHDGVGYAPDWNRGGELPALVRVTLSRELAGRTVSVSGTVRLP